MDNIMKKQIIITSKELVPIFKQFIEDRKNYHNTKIKSKATRRCVKQRNKSMNKV